MLLKGILLLIFCNIPLPKANLIFKKKNLINRNLELFGLDSIDCLLADEVYWKALIQLSYWEKDLP